MTMHEYALNELRKIEKQVFNDNKKLAALRLVLKEYATEEFPGTEKMNAIILECVNRHGGSAKLQQIADCIADHHIILPRNRLSLLLTKHPAIKYDKDDKSWRILPKLNE